MRQNRIRHECVLRASAILTALAIAGSAHSTPTTEMLCDKAAHTASNRTGVPLMVLKAITRTETGRAKNGNLEPWAWTVNMEGTGVWFQSRGEALSYAKRHLSRGATSFDVGCFQINYRWHGENFNSVEEMFDPEKNALYAAEFLRDLYAELGSWSSAAGAYHSRTEQYAKLYRARFKKIYSTLGQDAPSDEPVLANAGIARVNDFPLLKPSSSHRPALGSLVPVNSAPRGQLLNRLGMGG